MLYKESINNADITYLRITTSTVWTLYTAVLTFNPYLDISEII